MISRGSKRSEAPQDSKFSEGLNQDYGNELAGAHWVLREPHGPRLEGRAQHFDAQIAVQRGPAQRVGQKVEKSKEEMMA